MLHYRKNVDGNWKICSLTKDEARSIQGMIMKIGLMKVKDLRALAKADEVQLTDAETSVILSKVIPSYESLANDYIEGQIKKALTPPAPAPQA